MEDSGILVDTMRYGIRPTTSLILHEPSEPHWAHVAICEVVAGSFNGRVLPEMVMEFLGRIKYPRTTRMPTFHKLL